MRMVIKFILYALVVILLVSWVSTVIKSCGQEDGAEMSENYMDERVAGATEDDAIIEELLESEEEEAAAAENDDNTPPITSIDYSKKPDKDEEAMLQKVAKEKEKVEEQAPKKEAPKTTAPAKKSSSGTGNYFVITGSFGEAANAKKQQQKLRSLGYSGAEVVQFDGSKLHSVIAGRYTTNSEASRIADQLKSKHKVDCFVKKREL